MDRAGVQPEALTGAARALQRADDLRPLRTPVPERRGRPRALRTRRDRTGRLVSPHPHPRAGSDPALTGGVFLIVSRQRVALGNWSSRCPSGLAISTQGQEAISAID